MSNAEKIRSNVAVHGLQFAANWCKRNGIGFDTFYYVLFGKYPTI